MGDAEDFKNCPLCEHLWSTREQFVRDRALEVNGYMAAFGTPEEGLVLATHEVAGCGTTLAVLAGDLKSLYQGPLYTEFCADSEVCERHCLDDGDLEECAAPCAMAWVRAVLQYLRRHEVPPDSA